MFSSEFKSVKLSLHIVVYSYTDLFQPGTALLMALEFLFDTTVLLECLVFFHKLSIKVESHCEVVPVLN
jgi:hypothetical protein